MTDIRVQANHGVKHVPVRVFPDDVLELLMLNTGTHSDLFKK